MLVERLLARPIRDALSDTPVVLITGARQVGKTTLARDLLGAGGTFRTLDDAGTLAAAKTDPTGFVDVAWPLIIDEVQRAPELLLAVKAAVDRDRQPGRFVLTGSTDVMGLPALADTLAGRIELHRLRPLSIAEVVGEPTTVFERLDGPDPDPDVAHAPSRAQLIDLVLRGGYPVARERAPARRAAWISDYLNTVIQREVPSVADIQFVEHLPRLLRLIAAGSPGPLNVSSLTSGLGAPRTTVDRYVTILRQVFLLDLLAPWHANVGTRQVKSMRMLLGDSALQAWLLDLDAARLGQWQPDRIGPLLETFVASELQAQAGWSPEPVRLAWWRTGRGEEVDLVVERANGSIVGIEVKAAASVDAGDFRGLRHLQRAMGDRFQRGIVLYAGSEVLAFGDGLHAWPIAALWGGRALPP